MSQIVSVRRSLAASAVLALLVGAGAGVPAFSAPGNGNGGASASAPGQTKDKDHKGKGHHSHQGGHGNGHQGGHGNGHQGGGNGHQGGGNGHQGGGSSAAPGGGHAGGAGDPGGNNGTVKIETLGDLDGIPNNTPHPGCTFQIEWYGYDEGADIISNVSFAMHAPTSDVGLVVDGPSSVFVGGDPATGAGTDTGLDGTQAYTLSFDGAPHPKQGYHVKLTVATPRSHGNDTKTKVFWVEPCAEVTPGEETPGEETPGEETPGEETPGGETGVSPSEETLEGASTNEAEQGVLGIEAETTQNNASVDAAGAADLPTKVDAGSEGSTLGNLAGSPIALTIAGLGILIAAGGLLARRRSGATPLS